MLNVAAPGKFVLTLQSIPPFFIESILAFALAVLLAVPLIARLQLIFANRDGCVKSRNPVSIPIRRLHRHNRHIITQYPSPMITTAHSIQSLHLNSMHVNNSYYDIQQSLQTLTSVPFIDQSSDRDGKVIEVENTENVKNEGNEKNKKNEENEENEQIDHCMIGKNDPMKNIVNFEYQHYRHKLIKENFKKNYGHFQAPGNFVLNSIHLSCMDSQKEINNKSKNPLSVSNVASSNVNDNAHENISLKGIDHRDLFLTKKSNDKLETVDKTVGTEHTTVEVNQSPELINMKEHTNICTGSRRKLRAVCQLIGKHKSLNNNINNDHVAKSKIDFVETNLRPNTPKKNRKSLIRPRTPSSPSKPTKSADNEILNAINHFPIIETANTYSDITGGIQIQSDKLKDFSYHSEGPAISTNERNEHSPSHVASVIGKCSSMASSDAFSTCSSKNPERRLINNRLGLSTYGGGGVRGSFKHSLPKVNSRPRSSGASFAWEVPDAPDKISFCEISDDKKIISNNAKRPETPDTPAYNKKSEVLSVLESIVDLSCEATIDFQESTIDVDIKKIREMYDNAESARNVFTQVEESSRIFSMTNKKTKLPISSSNQKRINSNPKSMGESKETKPYLRARSGKYNKRPNSSESKTSIIIN
ncbi:hypothetical protein PV327_004003 [Microctonus hyperodae]|uniref:Uncharacterized protein n=1 Tax=Microctonus hyperodae TaxID=165561 RepID=A0AA39G577_MICHY|nr:hypothetical protein PV327_004003 [Microctonus hyperodae]